jgi:DNA primase
MARRPLPISVPTLKALQAIREHVDLLAVVQKTVPMTSRGRAWVGRCPFHAARARRGRQGDDAQAFSVNREKGFFYCFRCREKGTAIDFVMKTEGLTFAEAAERLAQDAGGLRSANGHA